MAAHGVSIGGVLVNPVTLICLCAVQKAKLPQLPPHAAYVRHPNECYDWGSYGWVLLQTGLVNMAKYRYFFFVNSSVRGPFLPAYARVRFLYAQVVSEQAGHRHRVVLDPAVSHLDKVVVVKHVLQACAAESNCCQALGMLMCTTTCKVFRGSHLGLSHAGLVSLDVSFHITSERRRQARGQHHQL